MTVPSGFFAALRGCAVRVHQWPAEMGGSAVVVIAADLDRATLDAVLYSKGTGLLHLTVEIQAGHTRPSAAAMEAMAAVLPLGATALLNFESIGGALSAAEWARSLADAKG